MQKNITNNELPITISKIFDVLETHNVFYWLDAGSLLKGIRDKTILTSSDIDVSVTQDQTNNLLTALEELSDLGYKYTFNGGYPMLEDMVTIFLPEAFNRIMHVDVYIFHKSDEIFFRRCFHKPILKSKSSYLFYLSKKLMSKTLTDTKMTNLKLNTEKEKDISIFYSLGKFFFYLYELVGTSAWYVIPEKYISDFKKVVINGRKFNVPVIYEQYLEMRYGFDWTTPKDRHEWFESWKKSDDHVIQRKKLRTDLSPKKYWARFKR